MSSTSVKYWLKKLWKIYFDRKYFIKVSTTVFSNIRGMGPTNAILGHQPNSISGAKLYDLSIIGLEAGISSRNLFLNGDLIKLFTLRVRKSAYPLKINNFFTNFIFLYSEKKAFFLFLGYKNPSFFNLFKNIGS